MPVPPRFPSLNVETLEDRTTPAYPITLTPGTYMPGDVLFSIAKGADRNQTLTALANSPWGLTAKELGFGVFKLTLKSGVTVQQALDGLYGNGGLGFVQPDLKKFLTAVPNDPSETDGTLWAHNNTGQNGGTAGADISAYAGWNYGTGTGQHIVAVLDSGVDYTHEDLAQNMWVNPDPTAPDKYGYNFINNTPDPMPSATPGSDHGTHVAGIIGAVGNNNTGVVGVAWKTRIMAIAFIDGDNGGTTSAEIQGINYAVQHGASIINGSFGGPGFDPAEQAAFDGATAQGVLFAIAAGNSSLDNDANVITPANFALTNSRVVTVAATDRNDLLADFSDYGKTTVTLGAPGVEIYSTLPGGGYGLKDGTSMATPQVAGALAVVWDAYPSLSPDELVDLLKRSTDPLPSLDGKTVTGGRLDLLKMFQNVSFGGYAVGADAGGGPNVQVFRRDGSVRDSFYAYSKNFTGGVRVAMADVNGDGVPDIITVPGPGGGPNVRVFDGKTLQLLYSFQAYPSSFTAGLYVAAGDVDGDGIPEIITGAGEGGGPNVRVFKLDGNGGATLASSFYAYSAGFSGGVRVAVGDYNRDGLADIVTTPGFGGGPHVKIFDGGTVLSGTPTILAQFMAGDPRANVGAYATLANINNTQFMDVVVGSGSGNREVRVYDGRTMAFINGFTVTQPGAPPQPVNTAPTVGALLNGVGLPNQLPTDSVTKTAAQNGPTAGLRVAALDINQDGVDDIIAIGGSGDQAVVRIRNGRSMTTLGSDRNVFGASFLGGGFVAASR